MQCNCSAILYASLILSAGHSEVPQLGLGTWGVDKADDLAQLFNFGIQCGYRHFDSASMYKNEHLTGELLSQHIGKTVSRQEIFITSKLANNVHAPKRVKPAITKTLQDLQLDYLDLYLIHWPMATFDHGMQAYDPEELKVSYVETYQAMEDLQQEGLTKAIGICNTNTKQLDHLISESDTKPAVVQMEIHPYLTQQKMIDYCQEHGIVVTAYGPLGSPQRPWREESSPNLLEDSTVKQIADKHNKTVAQILLRFAIQREITVLTRSINPERIEQNSEIFDFVLDDDDMSSLFNLNQNFRGMGYSSALDHPDHPFREGIDD